MFELIKRLKIKIKKIMDVDLVKNEGPGGCNINLQAFFKEFPRIAKNSEDVQQIFEEGINNNYLLDGKQIQFEPDEDAELLDEAPPEPRKKRKYVRKNPGEPRKRGRPPKKVPEEPQPEEKIQEEAPEEDVQMKSEKSEQEEVQESESSEDEQIEESQESEQIEESQESEQSEQEESQESEMSEKPMEIEEDSPKMIEPKQIIEKVKRPRGRPKKQELSIHKKSIELQPPI